MRSSLDKTPNSCSIGYGRRFFSWCENQFMHDLVSRLLSAEEPAAFEIINEHVPSNLIIICDHASNRVPLGLNNLGLTADHLNAHIAWDPGAAAVAHKLAQDLKAPLVVSNYSRLVIDCNRPLQSPELIPESSAQVEIPGNSKLSEYHRQARIEQLFLPYHNAIDNLISSRLQNLPEFHPRLLISVHSFTPQLLGGKRPWHVGVAGYRDKRLAEVLFQFIRESCDGPVGYDQPYAIDEHFDYSIPVHGEARGLHAAMIEIRQDLLTRTDGQNSLAVKLSVAVNGCMAAL